MQSSNVDDIEGDLRPLRLSASVRRVEEELRGKPVSAFDVARAIWLQHPEYGGGSARVMSGSLWPPFLKSHHVGKWIAAVADLFVTPDLVVHGRLLIAGLALLDDEFGRAIARAGHLQRILAEFYDPPQLTPEAERAWFRAFGTTAQWPGSERPQTRLLQPGQAVRKVAERWGEKPLPALSFVREIVAEPSWLVDHPITFESNLPASGPEKRATEWLVEVSEAFAPPAIVLHGRLVCVGLALLDEATGRALSEVGALVELARTIRGAPALRPDLEERWRALAGVSWDEITGRVPEDEA
ncbi:MAG TPA: hypothetical protein VFQ39_08205, partial [Longimicrobium sp.]|nr:hypothetical protein [Longimicrobium sp.]